MKILRYKTSSAILGATTLRSEGFSSGPYSAGNMAFYVGDDAENVQRNRENLAAMIDCPLSNWVIPKITHSTNFRRITAADKGRGAYSDDNAINDCDALYTFEKNILLGVFHADCTPMIISDPISGLVGVIHAGWPSTSAGSVTRLVNHLKHNERIDMAHCQVIIGPAIGMSDFEVGDIVRHALDASGLDYLPFIHQKNETHFYLDLAGLNAYQFECAGIPTRNITRTAVNITRNPTEYYSYRRDNGVTGRHLTFVIAR